MSYAGSWSSPHGDGDRALATGRPSACSAGCAVAPCLARWSRCCYVRAAGGVEFSWEGNDECDPASGRGWAVLEEDGSLCGRIFFHLGDDSGFTAVRKGTEGRF
jgi:hypothetical protein